MAESRNYFLTLCEEDLWKTNISRSLMSRNYFLTLCEEDNKEDKVSIQKLVSKLLPHVV